MLDLVITGGTAVLPQGPTACDIGVAARTIVDIAEPGRLVETAGGARVIDASGTIVIPGGIDPHVHCSWPLMLAGETQHRLSASPAVMSKAALHGGTTTLLDFCMCNPGETIEAAIQRRDAQWAGQCHADYAYHLMLQGAVDDATLAELGDVVQDGYSSVKIFTTDVTPSRRGRMVPHGSILEILKVVAKAGGVTAVHAEDNELVMHMYEKLIRDGRAGFENMAEVHSALSEDLSFNRVIRLAENVESAALYMMHISATTGVDAVNRSRARGFPIYGETLQLYLLATQEDYKRAGGQMYHTYPSLKTLRDQEALWEATRGGAVQSIGTDGVCCPRDLKLKGARIDDTTGGNVSLEPRIALMYTHMVEKRGYSLNEFVALTSTNIARIMGLYPRKGVLAIGSDADIVLLGLADRVLTADRLHESDYTPWEGLTVGAWPTMTILGGKVVVENETFHGSPHDGRWLARKVDGEVLARPVI